MNLTYFKPLFKSELRSKFSDKLDVPLSDSVLEFPAAKRELEIFFSGDINGLFSGRLKYNKYI